jgi:hypothetical protein
VVLASIPLAEPLPADVGRVDPTRRLLSDSEAEQHQARRVHGLRLRASLGAVLTLIVVGVWALTGAPNAWPVWPLLGIGLLIALDAWTVMGTPPARRSDLAGEPSARAFQRRRAIRATAGRLAIVNAFLIGVWLAGGAGYFWPAWVILGSAVALALKAAPWSHTWAERVQGAP